MTSFGQGYGEFRKGSGNPFMGWAKGLASVGVGAQREATNKEWLDEANKLDSGLQTALNSIKMEQAVAAAEGEPISRYQAALKNPTTMRTLNSFFKHPINLGALEESLPGLKGSTLTAIQVPVGGGEKLGPLTDEKFVYMAEREDGSGRGTLTEGGTKDPDDPVVVTSFDDLLDTLVYQSSVNVGRPIPATQTALNLANADAENTFGPGAPKRKGGNQLLRRVNPEVYNQVEGGKVSPSSPGLGSPAPQQQAPQQQAPQQQAPQQQAPQQQAPQQQAPQQQAPQQQAPSNVSGGPGSGNIGYQPLYDPATEGPSVDPSKGPVEPQSPGSIVPAGTTKLELNNYSGTPSSPTGTPPLVRSNGSPYNPNPNFSSRNNYFTASESGKIRGVGFGGAGQKELMETEVPERLGKKQLFEGNAATRWGEKYEPIAIDAYEQEYGKTLESPGFFTHETDSRIGATPDAVIRNPDNTIGEIVSIKAPYSNVIPEELPAYYKSQVQWEMDTLGVDKGGVYYYTKGGETKFFPVQPYTEAEKKKVYSQIDQADKRLQKNLKEYSELEASSHRVKYETARENDKAASVQRSKEVRHSGLGPVNPSGDLDEFVFAGPGDLEKIPKDSIPAYGKGATRTDEAPYMWSTMSSGLPAFGANITKEDRDEYVEFGTFPNISEKDTNRMRETIQKKFDWYERVMAEATIRKDFDAVNDAYDKQTSFMRTVSGMSNHYQLGLKLNPKPVVSPPDPVAPEPLPATHISNNPKVKRAMAARASLAAKKGLPGFNSPAFTGPTKTSTSVSSKVYAGSAPTSTAAVASRGATALSAVPGGTNIKKAVESGAVTPAYTDAIIRGQEALLKYAEDNFYADARNKDIPITRENYWYASREGRAALATANIQSGLWTGADALKTATRFINSGRMSSVKEIHDAYAARLASAAAAKRLAQQRQEAQSKLIETRRNSDQNHRFAVYKDERDQANKAMNQYYKSEQEMYDARVQAEADMKANNVATSEGIQKYANDMVDATVKAVNFSKNVFGLESSATLISGKEDSLKSRLMMLINNPERRKEAEIIGSKALMYLDPATNLPISGNDSFTNMDGRTKKTIDILTMIGLGYAELNSVSDGAFSRMSLSDAILKLNESGDGVFSWFQDFSDSSSVKYMKDNVMTSNDWAKIVKAAKAIKSEQLRSPSNLELLNQLERNRSKFGTR